MRDVGKIEINTVRWGRGPSVCMLYPVLLSVCGEFKNI